MLYRRKARTGSVLLEMLKMEVTNSSFAITWSLHVTLGPSKFASSPTIAANLACACPTSSLSILQRLQVSYMPNPTQPQPVIRLAIYGAFFFGVRSGQVYDALLLGSPGSGRTSLRDALVGLFHNTLSRLWRSNTLSRMDMSIAAHAAPSPSR